MSRQRSEIRLDEQTTVGFLLDVGRRYRSSISFVEGELVVRVPYGFTSGQVEELMISNKDWIIRNLKKQSERIGLPQSYQDGEKIMLLGEVTEICYIPSESYFRPYLRDGRLCVATGEFYELSFIKKQIDDFICALAVEVVSERMKQMSSLVGSSPNRLTFRSMTSRWGSCSSKGNICINYKLIQFPVECIDYVCIHELCHLKHMDHSKQFWALVESFCPDWKKLRERMKN